MSHHHLGTITTTPSSSISSTTIIRSLQQNKKASIPLALLSSASAFALAIELNTRRRQYNDDPLVSALPRRYNVQAIESYWSHRPITVVSRLCHILYQMTPLALSHYYSTSSFNNDTTVTAEKERAETLKKALTTLGPAFVKMGQQLSIRPDLISPTMLDVLRTLCDSVDPIEDVVALGVLREELSSLDDGLVLEEVFENVHLVASASLGQVYKAKLRSTGEEVAIKIQRPKMTESVSLDLFLLRRWGMFMDWFTSNFTQQHIFHLDLIDCFAKGSYLELDYEEEAQNQIHFKEQLQTIRQLPIHVPHVHTEYTTRRILTTEWIDGIKLIDAPSHQIKELIPVGVELFLTQLLDMGMFHSDPHPGNLYVKKSNNKDDDDGGMLCLLDFGLCATVDEDARRALTVAIVHLLTGDYDSLIRNDARLLGFLPDDLDGKTYEELRPILTKILKEGLLESGSDLRERKRRLMDISDELNEVFFRYPFSVPPFFALITRGLGLLEGIALSGDPDFDIFRASYPYAKKRAMDIFGTSNKSSAGAGGMGFRAWWNVFLSTLDIVRVFGGTMKKNRKEDKNIME